MKIKKILSIAAACVALFTLWGCADDKEDEVKKLITFHLASDRARTMLSDNRSMEVLPVSSLSLIVTNNQFLYNGDLLEVHLASVNLPDGPLQGFYFKANDRGKKRLFEATASNMGGFIVVKYDGIIVGARKIDEVINNGWLFVPPEVPTNDDMPKIVDNMSKAISTVNSIKDESDAIW